MLCKLHTHTHTYYMLLFLLLLGVTVRCHGTCVPRYCICRLCMCICYLEALWQACIRTEDWHTGLDGHSHIHPRRWDILRLQAVKTRRGARRLAPPCQQSNGAGKARNYCTARTGCVLGARTGYDAASRCKGERARARRGSGGRLAGEL